MQRLTAKELQRRYRAGERNFAGIDLSGESLRGMNLKGVNLSGADLSRTDIRSTNFTEASLLGTQFVAAKAGTQRRWIVPQLLIAFNLSALASIFSGTFWAAFTMLTIDHSGEITGLAFGNLIFGTLGFLSYIGFLGLLCSDGFLATFGVVLTALAILVASAFIFNVADAFAGIFVNAISLARTLADVFVGAIFIAGFVVFLSTFASAVAGSVSVLATISGAFITFLAGFFAFESIKEVENIQPVESTVTIVLGLIGVLANTMVGLLVSKRSFSGDSRDSLIRNIAVWISSWGSTKFTFSDLTNSSFSEAVLKSTHLYQANLDKVQFHLAKKVNSSRLGKTILASFQVQSLLTSLRGSGQSYVGLNLKGAYLARADLADADFTEADISNATLEGAILERANLTKTQALGTNFYQTILTGATLEAWNIDSTTQLDGAICDYVHLLRNQQERRPSSGVFAPGEFSKLFQEVLDTIDLIFQNGVDWKAFVRTFNDVQEQYGNADLGVQAIENKGDGVVVVKLHAAPDADKPAIHQSFTEIYQLALQEAEARYKAQLDAKDDQIADYRQQSANMQEVVQAAGPATD